MAIGESVSEAVYDVFAVLGLHDSEEEAKKARLASEMNMLIEQGQLSDHEAMAAWDMERDAFEDLREHRLAEMSLEDLVGYHARAFSNAAGSPGIRR